MTQIGFLASLLLAFAVPPAGAADPPDRLPYTWKNVQIGGGGFVSGFVFHPTQSGVLYARTDMGGAYRRHPTTGVWQPLLDWVSHDDWNLMGVESLALDPSDPERLYIAAGTYTGPDMPDGVLLRSTSGGRDFQRTALPFKLGGNENGRGNGERLAVDPNDGRILFLGTRNDGLWTSRDRGASFTRVAGFPAVARTGGSAGPGRSHSDGRDGIVFVLFDPTSGSTGQASRTVLAGVSVRGQPGVYRSDDGGLTWHAPSGQPTEFRPNHGVLAADGTLYVSYGNEPGPSRMSDGAVWRHDTRRGGWREITPEQPAALRRVGYAAVAVDARDPRKLIASTSGRPGGEELFRSTDGGEHWRPVFGAGAVFDASPAPYVRDTHLHWLHDIEIDPADPDHALFTTGYGGWETRDLGNADAGRPTHWRVLSTGIEETVALALHSPARGVPLISAIGDYSGFVHDDLDRPPQAGNPKPPFFGNTHDVTGAESKPEIIVRVGKPREGTGLGYSLDGGSSWRQPASVPVAGAAAGHVAVSADGAVWTWTPRGQHPYVTRDHGASWQPCVGLPRDIRVVADRVNPRRFYAIDLYAGRLFESTDGAASFQAGDLVLPGVPPVRGPAGAHNTTPRGDDRGGQDRLYAAPGTEADLWLAAYDGLYRGPDGRRLQRLPGVERIHAFGFGRAEREGGYPALYLAGTVGGVPGIHRSTDAAGSWVRINDAAHQWGLVLQVSGDPKTFGRVYVGTHGRGIVYGDPATPR